jgi:perosamine synthetase
MRNKSLICSDRGTKPLLTHMNYTYRIPPAAAPIYLRDLAGGVAGLWEDSPFLAKFQESLKSHFAAKFIELVSSGRAALVLILQALHNLAPSRRQVILPAFTCWTVPAAVVRAGLQPIPCDLAANTFDYDFTKLPTLLGADTLCVVAQHLYGVPAHIARLHQMLAGSGIFLVDDAAQAMGAKLAGKWLGTCGDVGLFSLGRGKNFSTGTGGVILTNNDFIAQALSEVCGKIKRYGLSEEIMQLLKAGLLALFIHPRLYGVPAHLPGLQLGQTVFDPDFSVALMSGVQAGLAQNWVSRMANFFRARRAHALYLLEVLQGLTGAVCPVDSASAGNGPRLPIFVSDDPAKHALLEASASQGLGISLTYPDAVDGIPLFREAPWHGSFPQARKIAREIVTLPIHPLLTERDLERLSSVLLWYLN